MDSPVKFELGTDLPQTGKGWRAIGGYDYSDYFSQGNLVSASISI